VKFIVIEELAYYLVYAPEETPLEDVVWAAGARWTIEQLFKLAKGQVGLAVLAVGASKRGRALLCPVHIPLTVPEIHWLLLRLF
jgi:hypothetical protein